MKETTAQQRKKKWKKYDTSTNFALTVGTSTRLLEIVDWLTQIQMKQGILICAMLLKMTSSTQSRSE
jgi:hypothetical protein